jgi:hypothetical protein
MSLSAYLQSRFADPDRFHPRNEIGLLALLSIFFWVLFFGYALLTSEPKPWGYTPHTIDVAGLIGLNSKIPVVNPLFRPWDTVGAFGIIAFLWYLLERRRFRDSAYIKIGVWIPFLTCFNPVFVWAFLHYSASTVAWRMMYLFPAGFIIGFLIVMGYEKYQENGLTWKNSARGLIVICTILSLFPITISGFTNRTSRLASFEETHTRSGAGLYEDLRAETSVLIARHHIRNILTDSVTGFVLYASLKGQIRHWLDHEYFPKNNAAYQEDLLKSDFTRHLLIINKRDGILTQNATLARHWSPQTLLTSSYYPENIDNFIKSHPLTFELLWERDRISIYLMHSKSS